MSNKDQSINTGKTSLVKEKNGFKISIMAYTWTLDFGVVLSFIKGGFIVLVLTLQILIGNSIWTQLERLGCGGLGTSNPHI